MTNQTLDLTESTPADTGSNLCGSFLRLLFIDHTLSLAGLGIAILMSFFEKRRSFHKDSCAGRPGALIPINLINGDKHVLAHAAAFGCTTGNIFIIFYLSLFGFDITANANPWVKPILLLARMVDLGLQYYPLFALIEYGTSNIVAPVLGLLYALTLLGLDVSLVFLCDADAIFLAFLLLPIYCSLLFISVKFARNIRICILKTCKGLHMDHSDLYLKLGDRCQRYVRSLIIRKKGTEDEGEITDSTRQKVLRIVENQKTCLQTEVIHRCSNRIVSIFFVSLVLIYQWIVTSAQFIVLYKQLRDQAADGQLFSIFTNKSIRSYIVLFAEVLFGSFCVASIFAVVITLLNLWKLYSSHRRHVRRLLLGNRKFIPEKCWDMPPSDILARNVMYPGMQIGHLLWGFWINLLMMMLVCVLLSVFLVLPLANKLPDFFLTPFRSLLPTVVMALVIHYGFFYFVRIFLQKEVVEEKGEPEIRRLLALTNWKAYQNVSYFMFFFYIFIGIFSCLRRIIISVFVGLYYLARLDKCTLIPGLEHFDKAYQSYVSFLRVELSHCNPVVITFCQMVLESDKQKGSNKNKNAQQFVDIASMEEGVVKRGAYSLPRRRWYKLYTLIRNPELVAHTKFSLEKLRSDMPKDICHKNSETGSDPKAEADA